MSESVIGLDCYKEYLDPLAGWLAGAKASEPKQARKDFSFPN